jgi:quercetin dioxygenase-like cupin family protein
MKLAVIATLLAASVPCFGGTENTSPTIKIEKVIESSSSWDGIPYETYPHGKPQITILKFTIAPHTIMKWHSHPIPNAGYILSGALTIERKDGTKRHFVAGQGIAETVNSIHRGITGAEPVVLIVFYPGTPGLPVSESKQ